MLAIRLPEDVEKRLDDLARRTGRTKTFYAREAILNQLTDLENLYREEKNLRRKRAGVEPIIPVKDLRNPEPSGAPSFVDRWQGKFRPADPGRRALQSAR